MNGKQKEELGARFRKESTKKLVRASAAPKNLKSEVESIRKRLTPNVLKSFPIVSPLLKKEIRSFLKTAQILRSA